MKITHVETFPFSLPQVQRDFQISRGRIEGALLHVVRLCTDEGLEGYGAAPLGATLISGETLEGASRVIKEELAPVLHGRDPREIHPIMRDVATRVPLNDRAKAGIDAALHDLAGKVLGLPAYQLLGGAFRTEIPVVRLVRMTRPDAMAADALKLTREGFRYLKLKVGSDPALDIDRVAAVRDACGPEIHLMIDANMAYYPKRAIAVLRQMQRYNVDLAEQPVPQGDIEGLALVRRSVDIPVEADESVESIADAIRVIRAEAADFVSIKLGKLGGMVNARKLAAICEAANIMCRVGTNTGGRLIEAANMHFIAATPNIDYACEVGEFARSTGDPASGLEVESGMMRVPPGNGLGLTVDLPGLA